MQTKKIKTEVKMSITGSSKYSPLFQDFCAASMWVGLGLKEDILSSSCCKGADKWPPLMQEVIGFYLFIINHEAHM